MKPIVSAKFLVPGLTLAAALSAGPSHADPAVLAGEDSADLGGPHYNVAAELLGARDWLGLYVTGSGPEKPSQLREVRLDWKRMPDDPPHTLHLATATPAGARLLVRGVPGVSAGRATTLDENFSLTPNMRTAELRLGDRTYVLELETSRHDLCDAVVTLASAGERQTLFDMKVASPDDVGCDDPHFEVHWTGDIDRDDKLDLLVNFSRKYSLHPRQLLLSSIARQGQLVGEAARYERSD